MIQVSFLMTLFFICNSALACVQHTTALLNGRITETESHYAYIPSGKNLADDRDYYTEQIKQLDSLWKATRKLEYYNDYGVALIYLGRYTEAEAAFTEIERISPGMYTTAANLGTTYELLAKNELALQWITKSVEIDSSSHDGSEWLHVKILEVKIKGDKYNTSEYLLGYNSGNDVIPDSSKGRKELERLRNSIFFQLNERMTFIKPKEKIVALLLFELGNITAITDDVLTAITAYDLAKAYGYESDLLDRRYKKFVGMQAKAELTRRELQGAVSTVDKHYNLVLIISIATLIALAYIIWRKYRNRAKP